MIHKKLMLLIIIMNSLTSCKSDKIKPLNIQKIHFKENKITVTPNIRINKTLDCWKLYYQDKEKVKIAREKLSDLMSRNHYSTEKEIKDNIQIKSDTIEELKYDFEELKTTFSQVGISLKTQTSIDTILSLKLNCVFGKIRHKQNVSWILNGINYTLKYRENLEVYDLLNIDYYLDNNMSSNDIKNKIAISLKVKKVRMNRHYGHLSLDLMGQYQVKDNKIKGDSFRLIIPEFVKNIFRDTYKGEGEIIEFHARDLCDKSENIKVHH